MDVKFATITSDPLKLDKRGDFQAANPVTVTVKIPQPCNTETPAFTLEISGVFSYNYAYIEKWGKYYFIGGPTYLDGNRLTVSGVCDVLTSNADEIKTLPINIVRGDKENKLLPDKMRTAQVNRQSEILLLTGGYVPAQPSDVRYVLTVQGGAHR